MAPGDVWALWEFYDAMANGFPQACISSSTLPNFAQLLHVESTCSQIHILRLCAFFIPLFSPPAVPSRKQQARRYNPTRPMRELPRPL